MKMTVTAAVTAAATVLAVPAAVAAGTGPDDKPAPAQTYQVTQKFISFNPTELKIRPGDTVIWTNKETDDTTHSVVQGNGDDIDSPDIQPGETFVWKFDHAGRWDIVCRFHPDMFMTIGVADKDGKVPPETPFVPSTPTLPANPTPSHGTVPGVTGLPIAHHRPAQRTY